MNESIENAIINSTNAIGRFQKSRSSGVPSPGNILKHKTIFMSEISDDITLLKSAYSKAVDKEPIEQILDRIAIEILQCGSLYFKQNPNATSFIEEHFMSDVHKVIADYPLSAAMDSMLRTTHESWHWHGR